MNITFAASPGTPPGVYRARVAGSVTHLQADGDALVAEVLRRLIAKAPEVVAEVTSDPQIRERLTALDRQPTLTHTPD